MAAAGGGCPWDRQTWHLAAKNGELETLRWARENGCPWDAETRDRAAAELVYTDDLGNLVELSNDEFTRTMSEV